MALKKNWNKDKRAVTFRFTKEHLSLIENEAKRLGITKNKTFELIIEFYKNKKFKRFVIKPKEDPLTLY